MYKQYKNGFGDIVNGIICTVNNTFIPFDPDNTDYQAYLKWLEEGGVPTPAEGTE